MALKKEIDIITYLRQNARIGLTSLSRITGIPVSTIYERIKAGRKTGLIRKFTALIDFGEVGFNSRAKVIIKVHRNDRDRLKEHLMNTENINSLYRINNNYDFLAEVVFSDIKEMEDFIDSMEKNYNIENIHVYFVLEDLRREEFMARKE